MAIYNPMDDLIYGDNADPAYAVREIPTIPTSPKVDEPRTTEQIQRELQDSALTQEFGQVFQPFMRAITPEEELKQQIEQKKLLNQQLLQEAQPIIQRIQQLPQGSKEQLLAIRNLEQDLTSQGFEGFNLSEVLGSAGEFLYGEERRAIEKAARGDLLTASDFGLISMAPISVLDFAFPGIAAKLATRGFTKIDDVLKSSLDIPEVKQVKQTFGGGFVPEGVMRAPETGGSGLPIRPTGKGGQSREYIDYRNSQTNQLVDIIKQNKPEDKDLSLNELIAKYDIQEQFDKGEPGRLKLKGPVRKILKEQLGEKQYEDLYKLAMAKGRIKRAEPGTENLIKAIEDLDDESFESKTSMAMTLADKAGIDSTNILRRYKTDKNVKNMMDQFINPSDPSGRAADVFKRVFKDVNDEGLDNFFDVPLSQINPTSMAQVQDLVKRMGVQDFKSPRKLLRSFLYDRYRSQKQAKGFEDLTEEQFLKRQYSPDQIQEMKDQFDNYIDVERDRLYLQIVGRKVLDDLAQNPKYKPYLQSLSDPNKLDELIVRGNKTHDQPMFVTRVKGKGRLKKGRSSYKHWNRA